MAHECASDVLRRAARGELRLTVEDQVEAVPRAGLDVGAIGTRGSVHLDIVEDVTVRRRVLVRPAPAPILEVVRVLLSVAVAVAALDAHLSVRIVVHVGRRGHVLHQVEYVTEQEVRFDVRSVPVALDGGVPVGGSPLDGGLLRNALVVIGVRLVVVRVGSIVGLVRVVAAVRVQQVRRGSDQLARCGRVVEVVGVERALVFIDGALAEQLRDPSRGPAQSALLGRDVRAVEKMHRSYGQLGVRMLVLVGYRRRDEDEGHEGHAQRAVRRLIHAAPPGVRDPRSYAGTYTSRAGCGRLFFPRGAPEPPWSSFWADSAV